MTDINKNILLNRLHKTIKEKNIIYNDEIKFLNYDITITPVIEKIERKHQVLCILYFYVKAPIFKDIFFECTSGLSYNEEKAIFLASDNFVFCALDGILDFFKGIYHYEITTSLAGTSLKFTVCESPMIELGSKEHLLPTNSYDEDKHSSFIWESIKYELIFMLGHLRLYYIKVFAAKMPNGEITGEVRINDIPNNELLTPILKEINNIESESEFLSFKQFFFTLQDELTYAPYPYSKDEIYYFVNEALYEFEKNYSDYNEYKKNILNIIFDKNIAEEIINFIPEICAYNSFKDVNYNDRISVFIGEKEYYVYKWQFTGYALIEDALLNSFKEKILKKETYSKIVRLSSIYNSIKEAQKNNYNMADMKVTITIRFSENYKMR